MAPRALSGYLAALAAAVLFGSVNVAAKVALRDTHPLTATAISFAASGAFFLPLLVSFRPRRRDWPLVVLSALLGGALAALALYAGLARIPASTASLLLTAEMVFTAVIARAAFGERPPRAELPGLAMLAAAAVVAATGQGLAAGSVLGILFVLLATLCWGVDNNLNAVLAPRYDLRHLVAARAALGGALAVALVLLFDAPVATSARSLVILVGTGAVGLGLATLAYYAAIRGIGPTRAVVVFSTSSAWGAIAAFVVLREPLGWHHAGAFALAAAGFALLWRAVRRIKE